MKKVKAILFTSHSRNRKRAMGNTRVLLANIRSCYFCDKTTACAMPWEAQNGITYDTCCQCQEDGPFHRKPLYCDHLVPRRRRLKVHRDMTRACDSCEKYSICVLLVTNLSDKCKDYSYLCCICVRKPVVLRPYLNNMVFCKHLLRDQKNNSESN